MLLCINFIVWHLGFQKHQWPHEMSKKWVRFRLNPRQNWREYPTKGYCELFPVVRVILQLFKHLQKWKDACLSGLLVVQWETEHGVTNRESLDKTQTQLYISIIKRFKHGANNHRPDLNVSDLVFDQWLQRRRAGCVYWLTHSLSTIAAWGGQWVPWISTICQIRRPCRGMGGGRSSFKRGLWGILFTGTRE